MPAGLFKFITPSVFYLRFDLFKCLMNINRILFIKQLDPNGYPTVEGLVSLYTEGINQKEYILATLQAVTKCLGKTQKELLALPQSIDGE